MDQATVLRASFEVLHWSGATRLFASRFRGLGTILCLHQVVPNGGRDDGFAPNHQLEISPAFLDATLAHAVAAGFELISLGEAVSRLREGRVGERPFIVLTLDDGYKDNMQYAVPVFQRHACPYTIFVAPRIADGTCELWWRILEKIIAATALLNLEIEGATIDLPCETSAQKKVAWRTIFPLLKIMPEYRQREWIRREAQAHDIDVDGYCRDLAMTWGEIRELNRDPLCTIGAHTLNHYAVARLSAEDCLRELVQSRAVIADQLGESVNYFAYPYGDEPAAGPRDFEIAAKAGFLSSVTTRKGPMFVEHALHLQALPRVMLSGRYQKIRYLDALLSGVPLALLNRFNRLNVD